MLSQHQPAVAFLGGYEAFLEGVPGLSFDIGPHYTNHPVG